MSDQTEQPDGHRPSQPGNTAALPLARYSRLALRDIAVGYVRLPRGIKPEHEHASLQISIALSRRPLVAFERKLYGITEKQLIVRGASAVIAPWQRHTILWNDPSEWVSFHLEPDFVRRTADAFGAKQGGEIVSRFGVNDSVICGLGQQLANVLRQDDEPPRLFIESLAGKIAEHVLTSYVEDKTLVRKARGGLAPAKLRRAIEFIDEHLSENIALEELAASADLSRFHFARAFKAATDLAPHQFVVRRRLELAQRLLADKRIGIGEIALMVGYRNHSRFSSLFQKHTALTPKQFRALL